MSDRRSFSEISSELLKEHGVDARVDRVWERLSRDLSPARRRERWAATALASAAVVGATFASGVFVGAHFSTHDPAPLAALEAEPAAAPRPVAPKAEPNALPSRAAAETPHGRPARHSLSTRVVDVAPESPVEAPEPAPVGRSGPAEWQRLADEGEYARALESLEASGGFEGALRDATVDQLMSLVDVARATGQRDRAIVALRRVVSEHGADPSAPVAAWMLGSELAKGSDPAAAEQAFALYRALSPNGDFAEDALARQIDMAALQGNVDHEKKLAEQYLKEFPDGPRSADIQARLEQWAREPSPERPPESAPLSVPDGGAR
ncbi:MAG TPA: hypothetical protein VHE30_27625 [Polyangiaceae bacterium]|nr:hypothetical protein [Polyangiaceae bacterium]